MEKEKLPDGKVQNLRSVFFFRCPAVKTKMLPASLMLESSVSYCPEETPVTDSPSIGLWLEMPAVDASIWTPEAAWAF
ncbi:hypothetical protein ElyMa_002603200 [Elysia marginata]|uniref:Uncharacterized protein n=1 Tax=Elysia marginata TaxID=1093978 RepID=A0AAV4H2M3_9GAST|nr:hypothetical protein ElyMa_002603200 [Elysia marginata]